jgi:hypothetical protein
MNRADVILIHGEEGFLRAMAFSIVEGLRDELAADALALVAGLHSDVFDPDHDPLLFFLSIEASAKHSDQLAILAAIAQNGGVAHHLVAAQPVLEPVCGLPREAPAQA